MLLLLMGNKIQLEMFKEEDIGIQRLFDNLIERNVLTKGDKESFKDKRRFVIESLANGFIKTLSIDD